MSYAEKVPFTCENCGHIHEAHLVPVYWTGEKPKDLTPRLIIELADQGPYILMLTCKEEAYPGDKDLSKFLRIMGDLFEELVANVGLGRGKLINAQIMTVDKKARLS